MKVEQAKIVFLRSLLICPVWHETVSGQNGPGSGRQSAGIWGVLAKKRVRARLGPSHLNTPETVLFKHWKTSFEKKNVHLRGRVR